MILLILVNFYQKIYPDIQIRLPCTSNTIFHGHQIIHCDPLNAKRRWLHFFSVWNGFHGNPLYDSREWG